MPFISIPTIFFIFEIFDRTFTNLLNYRGNKFLEGVSCIIILIVVALFFLILYVIFFDPSRRNTTHEYRYYKS